MNVAPPIIVSLRASAGELPDGAAASIEVRRLVGEVFAHISPARLVDLSLLADELVMDAQRHGGQLREVQLCRFGTSAVAHIEIISTPSAVFVPDESDAAAAALGRLLIEDLAIAWGLQRESADWMTWAEV